MTVNVFAYEWTYWDGALDEKITRTSGYKVTRAFIEQRKKNNLLGTVYRLLEDTKETVDAAQVDPDGRYHPDWKR